MIFLIIICYNNSQSEADEVPDYTKKAQAMDLENLPGVYEVTASVGDKIEDGKTKIKK